MRLTRSTLRPSRVGTTWGCRGMAALCRGSLEWDWWKVRWNGTEAVIYTVLLQQWYDIKFTGSYRLCLHLSCTARLRFNGIWTVKANAESWTGSRLKKVCNLMCYIYISIAFFLMPKKRSRRNFNEWKFSTLPNLFTFFNNRHFAYLPTHGLLYIGSPMCKL